MASRLPAWVALTLIATACTHAQQAPASSVACEGNWSPPFPLHRGDGRPVYVERGTVDAHGSRTLALGAPTFLWMQRTLMLPAPGADSTDAATAFTRAGVLIDSAGVAVGVPPVDVLRGRRKPRVIVGDDRAPTIAWESFDTPGDDRDPGGIDVATFDNGRWTNARTVLRGRRMAMAEPAAARPGARGISPFVAALVQDGSGDWLAFAQLRDGRWQEGRWRGGGSHNPAAAAVSVGDDVALVTLMTRPGSIAGVYALHGRWTADSIAWSSLVFLDTVRGRNDAINLARLGGDTLVAVWHLDREDSASTMYTAVSIDRGRTWQKTQRQSMAMALYGPVAVVDAAGGLHLLFTGTPISDAAILGAPGVVMHARWESGRWTTPRAVTTAPGIPGPAAGTAPGGKIVSSGAVGDHTPPTAALSVGSTCCVGPDNSLRGYYYVGDTLLLYVGASDNYRLSKVRWEVLPSGPVDSTFTSEGSWGTVVKVPITATWAAMIGHGARVTSWDASGLSTQRVVGADPGLVFAPTVRRPSIAASLLGSISAVRASATRNAVYLAQSNFNRVTVLNPATLAVTGTIGLTRHPFGLDLTPSGDSLVIAIPEERALAIVNLRDATPTITKITLTALADDERPQLVAVAANGKAIVTVGVTGTYARDIPPLLVTLATGAQQFMAGGADGSLDHLETSPERDIVVIATYTCTQVYFAARDSLGTCKALTHGRPTISRAPHVIAIGRSIYDTNLTLIRSIPSVAGRIEDQGPGQAGKSYLTSDGQLLFHTKFGAGLARSRVSDGSILDRSPSSSMGHGLVLPGDTSLFHWTPTIEGSDVGLIDLRTSEAVPVNLRASLGSTASSAARRTGPPRRIGPNKPAGRAAPVRLLPPAMH
ncbi:MAG TPA: hypothetical protein VEB19_03190 [Gemmatimonadaceae bacterium]|nr:hypothetical protein [Gemmatimonadaceae bacterium]